MNIMVLLRVSLLCLVALSVISSCKDEPKKSISTEPITFSKEGELEIYRGTKDSLITQLEIEIAESDYEIETGLMYREKMEANQAMLFIFPDVAFHSFYMKNTLIPLDIIFIDEGLNIVNIRQNAAPLDESGIPSGLPVQYVLEINAGLSDKWGIQLGDRIVFNRQ
ncbi:DUF192 domain-containing protein [Lentiprolixibacter aurantiacus]|uniref:DUF192 domain-containing protein n=1 Tax=Lentiprolixibacter aurantiacus TaxID=2993939 RepID=A0AAE3MND4_9FLAO|nr:DUF192 domain-containing protein [Lentiprolixibacter aurantiacus]MCX2720583.1 DUF192 domain-containing protein [Lentiprolixibacter aurantiacus]